MTERLAALCEGNQPAFPVPDTYGPMGEAMREGSPGMTLRDWFAGQAVEQCMRNALSNNGCWDPDNVAYHAYLVADAMLRARAHPETNDG